MFYPQLGTLDEEAKRLTAAEKGTYTHLFMELADYENAEKSVSGELERLVKKGIFSERESKGVYTETVQKYFESDFYRRVKASEDVRREMQFMVRADDAGLDKQFPELIATECYKAFATAFSRTERGIYSLITRRTISRRSQKR